MLTMVMEKPMQVIKVSAVPLCCGGAHCATSAENCGESDITDKLHININPKNNGKESSNTKGAAIQQQPEHSNEYHATFLLPARFAQ